MYVGILQVELDLPAPSNLKERRRLVVSIKDRIRRQFQAAIADVGVQDAYHECTLGLAVVSNDPRHAQSCCQAVLDWLEAFPDVQVQDHQLEIL